ncbi:hypothetical protein WJX82_005255 [Trebouxia sp. C0006]
MGTLPVWIKRTQTAGLIVTGAAIGYYYVSPALRVEEVSLPANTLLAKARMFGIDGKKAAIYDTQPYQDCFKVTVPKETLSRIASKNPEDLMLTYARSFLTSPVFKLERGAMKLRRVPDSLTDAQIESSDLQPGFRISAFEVAERTDKELLLRWLSERKTGEITAGYTWLGIAPSVLKAPSLRPLDQEDDSYWETVKGWEKLQLRRTNRCKTAPKCDSTKRSDMNYTINCTLDQQASQQRSPIRNSVKRTLEQTVIMKGKEKTLLHLEDIS